MNGTTEERSRHAGRAVAPKPGQAGKLDREKRKILTLIILSELSGSGAGGDGGGAAAPGR